MTELEMRKKFVTKAISFLNLKEADGSFRQIIDLYNSITPLPGGYRLTYYDPWCAGFVSAVAQACGYTKFIFPECSCDRMIELYRRAGRWQENDAYVPQIGDIIMYDWEDNGYGDNVGSADHVGIVTEITGKQLKVIEGNKSDMVTYRFIMINGQSIRGYCLPDFAKNASEEFDAGSEITIPTPTINNTPNILKMGMKGDDIRELQEKLIKLGYSCGDSGADGEFGKDTLAAVIKYQTQKGLEPDGEVGPLTMASIDNNSGALSDISIAKPAAKTDSNEEIIWDFLMSKIQNAFAVAGIMGNLNAESALKPNNLQDTYEKSLGYSDDEYTKAVDNYTYSNFIYDAAGYGLAQWTFWSRKKGLLDYAKSKGVSIGDIKMQIEYVYKEISEEYPGLLSDLKNVQSVKLASDMVMLNYERPADQGEKQKETRSKYGEGYYKKYHDRKPGEASKSVCGAEEMKFMPKIGDTVKFTGSKEYISANGLVGVPCKAGTARVTNIVVGAKHPFHLVKIANGGSNVYGWVNSGDIQEA